MSVRKHLIHVKSNQLMTGSTTEPKAPESEVISYGEIAINYLKDKERIFIKNSNDEIVPFYSGKVIDDNEAVTARALSELDGRIIDIEESGDVVSQALCVLNDKVEQINAEKDDFNNMESVTYSVLKSKRDNGELVPGKHYRITDYVTTTVQDNTQSAAHQFDVVVLALDERTLSENSHAMLHEGDTYFSTNKADLSAWDLKYCLDNDTDRFAWADTINGKGVIYYMKDEWSNECPYDFKNIQFKRWAVTKTNASSDDPFNNRYVGINNDGEILPNGYDIPDDNDFKWLYTFSGQSASWDEESDSIIYPDDITRDTEIYDLSNVDMHGFYNENTDPVGCSNNIIKEYYGGRNFAVNTLTLNNIIFTGWFINVETLPSNYEELYGDGIFEMMSVPFSNTFENECYNNTFGNDFQHNTFGNYCGSNTFGNYFQYNTFGNYCGSNTFGNSVNRNSFGNGCGSNTFGNNAYGNTFGNRCYNNSFGNGCGSNTFGNSCFSNTFGNDFQYNTFGNAVNHVTFSKDYTYYVIVENGNQYITLTSTATTSSSNLLRNITIAQGVNNTTTNKSISHNSVNDTIKTTYQPANSVVSNV